MNVAAHDRREERRIAELLVDALVHLQGASAVRSPAPQRQRITATALRKKIHQLGPTASFVRVGPLHYVCTIGRSQRYEGYVGEVNEQLQPLFNRLNIS